MTLSEFKAWFEGYTEGLDGAPTEKQFKRIKAKVSEITGTPITQTVFVDRYRDYQRYWDQPKWFGGNVSYSAGSVGHSVGNAVLNAHSSMALESARYEAGSNQTVEWDSHAAMYAAGKAELAEAAE